MLDMDMEFLANFDYVRRDCLSVLMYRKAVRCEGYFVCSAAQIQSLFLPILATCHVSIHTVVCSYFALSFHSKYDCNQHVVVRDNSSLLSYCTNTFT